MAFVGVAEYKLFMFLKTKTPSCIPKTKLKLCIYFWTRTTQSRTSGPTLQKQPTEVFCKKRCSASLRPATLLKKGLWHRCFPVNFVKFLRTPFFTDYLWMTAFTNLNTIYRDVLKFWDMMAIIRWISLQFQLTINQYHVNQQLVYTVKKAAL